MIFLNTVILDLKQSQFVYGFSLKYINNFINLSYNAINFGQYYIYDIF